MAEVLWGATWQGLLALGIAWLLCRLFRGLPASYRQAIWWLACFRLIAGLFLPIAITVPVSSPVEPYVARVWRAQVGASTATSPIQTPNNLDWTTGLVGLWLVGVAIGLFQLLREAIRTRRLVAAATLCSEPDALATLRTLSARSGLARPPQLRQSSQVVSPLVVGLFRPTVLIPETFRERLTPAEQEAAFAHELAHLVRADLLTGWVPTLAKILFWFLPPVHWAVREWEVERETACDSEALSLTQADPVAYSRLLLNLVSRESGKAMPAALGATNAFHTLKRRIEGLGRKDRRVPRAIWIGAVLALSPWKTVGAAPESGLLQNASIEAGNGSLPAYWVPGSPIHSVQYRWDRGVAHSGTSSLAIFKTDNRYFPIAGWSQRFAVKNSRCIEVSSWIRADRMHKAVLDVQFLREDGVFEHAWVAYIGAKNDGDPPATHDWKRYGAIIAIPKGATEILVSPQVYGPGKAWFDDLSARFTNEPPTPLDLS